ncbi:MAG: ribonuclease HI [Bacteroidia bacterium]|nr:ribonuclease HI [Bacteroidia bacterium]
MINIYTDGSARGNPGPGGYGIVLQYGKHSKELSAGYRNTTNNRMELLAVIRALETLKINSISVVIHTDSKYVCDAVEKGWLFNWNRTNFKGKKNADLWRLFLALYNNFTISFKWIKGHAGHKENERCDQLATNAADDTTNWLIDEGYESGLYN